MIRTRSAFLVLAVAAILWAGWNGRGQAQQNDPISQDENIVRVNRRVGEFLREIANENTDEAVDRFLTRSPLAKDAKRVTQLKESIRREIVKYGDFLGMESIKLEHVGQSLIRGVYLYHCTDYPVAWHFTFYRAEEDGDWSLIALRFNVDYEKLPATPESQP